MALALGGNTVAAAASTLLPQLIADHSDDDSWKKRHAALITLAQVSTQGEYADSRCKQV